MSDAPLLAAEFDDPALLVAAIGRVRAAGFTRIDALTPFPIAEVDTALGQTSRAMPWIAGLAAIAGGIIIAAVQWWASASYPQDVGGRPIFPWPAFVSTTVIVAILWGALGTFAGLLVLLRLPRLNHPVFAIPGIERLWDRRFYLLVETDDPAPVRALLEPLAPRAMHEVGL